MSGGGKSGGGGGQYTVGYKYMMGVHVIACHGPVDRLNRLIIGEREAWSGSVTDNATIYVDRPDLFGGDSREGGVQGHVDVMMGRADQGRSDYLATHQDAKCPAFRGLFGLLFKQFLWASGNPYFKSPWIDATRVLAGWQNDTPWNPADAFIGDYDMNPAHLIYQCLTDTSWGMGYSAADMEDESWRYAATKLKNEGFGISIIWDTQSSVEDFIGIILNHINGAVGINLATGKFRIKLIRDDYDVSTLPELNESNVIELKSFQRAAFGDSANEMVVTYTDRDQNDKPIAVQDIASIAAQGRVISVARSYPGIREPELAARVALRDLKTLSAPLAKAVVVTNRVMWDKEKGDVVRFNWPSRGINGTVYRIIDIDKGTLVDGKITVTMVEDVFGLPNNSYVSLPPSQWVDTVVPPVAVNASKAVEAPYWEVVKSLRLADQNNLDPDYGFGLFVASRGAVRSTLNYVLSSSADNSTYVDVTTGHFNPVGTLSASISAIVESVTLTGAYDLDSVVLSEDGGYAYIGDECVAVTSFNPESGVIGIKRGVLDTVPKPHVAGTKMFFMTGGTAYDPTEHVAGETVYYKPRPATGIGTLDLDDATAVTVTMNNRATRPYPPGNFKIDGQHYPITITGPTFTVSWAHRDRIAQTVDLNDYLTGNIGPEPGVSYVIRIYNATTLLRTYEIDGLTTDWSYPSTDDAADGHLATIRITLSSKRGDLESLQFHDHSFQRTVASGSVGIEAPPVAPHLVAADSSFAINLTWTFGDTRTNIDYIEIRVSEDPDFNHSTPLVYADYPDQDYLHELGSANTFRWYWARVADNGGMLSPWSNMVSARALSSSVSPSQMLSDINDLLSDGSGAAKIEMRADRFSIVSPDGAKTPFALVDIGGGVYKTLLNSDVLIGGDLDIANLKSGSLPTDVILKLGGGTIELDGAGEIRIFKDTNPNADFVKLSSGEIRFLRYISGAYQTYNYLSRLESGIANSGSTVTIPGYWKAQPRVMVSPAILSLYKATYSNQDQAIACEAKNLQETVAGSGIWRFDAVATLNLAAASGGGALGLTSGSISSNTYTTATQVTAANCNSITPTVNLTSYRGNGASQYLRRTVRWRVEYYNGSAWVAGAWNTVAMGDQTGQVTNSALFTFPSSAAWQWRIAYEAYDTDGSVFGAISYTYTQSTTTAANINPPSPTSVAYGQAGTAVTPTYAAPSGSGEIYEINYSVTPSIVYRNSSSTAGTTINGVRMSLAYGYSSGVFDTVQTYNHANSSGGVIATGQVGLTATLTINNQTWSPGVQSQTVSGSNLTFNTKFWELGIQRNNLNSNAFVVSLNLNNITAVVKRRTVNANSATPANTFNLTSYTYTLTTAQVLATGSLNWQAIGE